MILGHAPLSVIPGREQQFEAAFAEAAAIIPPTPGSRSVTRSRCVDRPDACLLVVWDRLADHTGSAGLPRTTSGVARLHHFYHPFPVVEHYVGEVTQA